MKDIDDGGPYNGIDWQASYAALTAKYEAERAAREAAALEARRWKFIWQNGLPNFQEGDGFRYFPGGPGHETIEAAIDAALANEVAK